MNRIDIVRSYVDEIFRNNADESEKRVAYVHSYGVAQCCALLANKRGLDPELAIVIGLLHDVYSYKTGVADEHAVNGAEMVRVAFKYDLNNMFSEREQILIKSAIYHHSDKGLVHDEYDELLKDADIFQNYLYDVTDEKKYTDRVQAIIRELPLPMPEYPSHPHYLRPSIAKYDRNKTANIAETLAVKRVTGVPDDSDFERIIRYFPEKSAYNELKNAWCAAFVYHCLYESGLCLPIRPIHNAKELSDTRLACVIAWYEWGEANGFCRYEKDGYEPQRGDIVIYSGIIPKEDKSPNSTWCDHIGIVLSCDGSKITVAEGNVGNKNVAGIVIRKRDNTIGCYLHISPDYCFDGWMTDYKTGEKKILST
jgi:putative nucleotidyltransferase with HDIG domain